MNDDESGKDIGGKGSRKSFVFVHPVYYLCYLSFLLLRK